VASSSRVSKRVIPLIDSELNAIVTDLQTGNARSATELRFVMLTGLLIAIVLAALRIDFECLPQRQDASLREARQQRPPISCRTVKDGLFCSTSISSSAPPIRARSNHCFSARLRRLPFEKLLKDISLRKDTVDGIEVRRRALSERTKENGQDHQSARRNRGQLRYRTGQGVHALPASSISNRVRVGWENNARVGGSGGRQRPGGSCPRTAVFSTQAQAQSIPCWAFCKSIRPASLVLERFQCRMKMINAVLREGARGKWFRKKLDTCSGRCTR